MRGGQDPSRAQNGAKRQACVGGKLAPCGGARRRTAAREGDREALQAAGPPARQKVRRGQGAPPALVPLKKADGGGGRKGERAGRAPAA